jgi:hypothetical protein
MGRNERFEEGPSPKGAGQTGAGTADVPAVYGFQGQDSNLQARDRRCAARMQHSANEFSRRPLLGSWVNKDSVQERGLGQAPALALPLSAAD